jgi:hypothetical protein
MTLDNDLKIPQNDEEVKMAIAFLVRDMKEIKGHIEDFCCSDSDRGFITRKELYDEYGPLKEGFRWVRRGFFWTVGLLASAVLLQLLYRLMNQVSNAK